MAPPALYKRPLDLLYVAYFLFHIPVTLSMVVQLLLPKEVLPAKIQEFQAWYLEKSGDPILLGGFGRIGQQGIFAWSTAGLYMEIFVQFPIFCVALWGLWKASARINVLIAMYAASTAHSIISCVATILALPTTSDLTVTTGIISLSKAQRNMLLQSYLPMLAVSLIMTLDMGWRTSRSVGAALKSSKAAEAKSS
ncbi:hypothetical protein CALVIDRAFT_16705 [Calocera viscosa TUFC12733]|uniref:EXPERA domain-containing protein n=1 Tax=Calocera viscosa (strain TUFC12733) TaxID=1330018 RepID=A0A167SA36_CALVF|nr:hypothetical protein CALVIDRAFT_16705 [Calocera viscosa TUFC12733]